MKHFIHPSRNVSFKTCLPQQLQISRSRSKSELEVEDERNLFASVPRTLEQVIWKTENNGSGNNSYFWLTSKFYEIPDFMWQKWFIYAEDKILFDFSNEH